MEEITTSKPVVSVLGKAPNWYQSGIMGVDESLGVIYYCAEEYVFALDAADLSYLAAWPAHGKRTNCLAVSSSATGPSLVTGGGDKVVRLWAPKLHSKGPSSKQVAIFEHTLHRADITAVQWSSDNQTVISADSSGKVAIFMPLTGKARITSLFHTRITCMDLVDEGGQDMLAIGADNGAILVCQSEPGALPKVQHRLLVKNTKFQEVKWQPRRLGAQKALAATCDNGLIRVWTDFASTPIVKPGAGPKGKKTVHRYTALAWIWYEGEAVVMFGTPEGVLNAWTPFAKRANRVIAGHEAHKGHSRHVFSLVPFTTSHGTRIVSTSMDRSIILWGEDGIICSINTLGGPARSLAFAPLQPALAAVGVADKAIRLWSHQEACAYFKRTLWRTEQSSVCRVAFHPAEGGVLAFANSAGLVGVFLLDKGEKVYCCPARNPGPPDSLQWVPLEWVATNATSDEAAALVSFSVAGSAVCNFYPSPANDLSLSSLFTEKLADASHMMFACANAWVAVGFFSGQIQVFSMPSVTEIYSCTCGESSVKSVEWSQDDGSLAVGHKDGAINIHAASRFSTAGGVVVKYPQPSFSLVGHADAVLTMNWSPHSESLLASGDSTGNTHVWDVRSCVRVASFKAGTVAALCVRWSPLNPNFLFTCSEHGVVWQWDLTLNPSLLETNKRGREEVWAPMIRTPPQPTPEELASPQVTPLLPQDKSYYLKLWGGRTREAFEEEMAKQLEPQNDLTKWLLHLALSPLDGPDAYSRALLQTAQAYRAKQGDPHISASLFASAGYIADAVECLTSKGFYLDAVALARNRLPEGHAHLASLYLEYAKHLMRAKSTQEACRWFILGGDVDSAIDAVASRNTRESLLLALELSLKHKHKSYPLRVWRYSVACQVEGAHGEAALALLNLPPSLPVVACQIFTLTDGSYIHTAPVENEDLIDLDDSSPLEREQIFLMWSKFGLSLAKDRNLLYQKKDSPLETFAMAEVCRLLATQIGDRPDPKGLEVYKFICQLSDNESDIATSNRIEAAKIV